MIFKMNRCDFGLKIDGVDYTFTDVRSITIEDPERNALTRGANGINKIGIAYRVGVSEAKKWTVEQLNMSRELKELLDTSYAEQKRIDVYAIDRADGSSKMARSALLCNKPQQLTLDESPESMNVTLEFETYDSDETHKS